MGGVGTKATADEKTARRKAFYSAWGEGKASRKKGESAAALASYDRALALFDEEAFVSPDLHLADTGESALCDLWSDIAAARMALGDPSAALEAIERSLSFHVRETNATPLYNKAVILAKLNRHREAIDACDRAIAAVRALYALPPEKVGDYFLAKAESLEALGEREAAIANYRYALPLGAGRGLHADAKAKLKQLTGKVPRAKRMWPEE